MRSAIHRWLASSLHLARLQEHFRVAHRSLRRRISIQGVIS